MSDKRDGASLIVVGRTPAKAATEVGELAVAREFGSGNRASAAASALVHRLELFHDRRVAYAAVRQDGCTELLEIGHRPFDLWLRRVLREAGVRLTKSERRDLVEEVESVALFDRSEEPVLTRVAEGGRAIYIDLGGETDKAIRITPLGWDVVSDAPVRFRRTPGTRTLPRPVPGERGAADRLKPLLNVDEQHFPLIVGWILGAIRPRGPYPLLVLQGEQGTAKSTVARIVAALVDPRDVPLRALPRSERDLAIGAQHAHVLVYDNLSGLSTTISDALCRVSTGGGLAVRRLYTDSREIVLEASRPIIATGIDAIATRPDLAERAIVLQLPVVKRRMDERALWQRFHAVAGAVLGAILDGIVSALARYDATTVDDLPRMADFARWVTAAEPGLGWPPGTIVRAFRGVQASQTFDSFSSDPIAPLIPRVLELAGGRRWSGTASQLFTAIQQLAEHRHGLPRAPNALTAHLGRIAPVLRAAGYEVRAERSSTTRTVVIERSS